jgi:flagellar biosynthesis protein FlhG
MKKQEPPRGANPENELELFREPDLLDDAIELDDDELEDLNESHFIPTPAKLAVISGGTPLNEDDELLEQEEALARRRPRIVAISGAKGGVGKTMLTANLGLYFATVGRSVILVDADPDGANLHTAVGTRSGPAVRRPRRTTKGIIEEENQSLLQGAVATTPFTGVSILRAVSDELAARSGCVLPQSELIPMLRSMNADYVVVDLGSGLTRDLIDAYLGADLSIYVTLPEPTAIENTYAFIRGAFARFLLSAVSNLEARAELARRMRSTAGATAPMDLWTGLEQEQNPIAEMVRTAIGAFEPHIAINQTRLRADLELGPSMRSAALRRLGITIDYLGHIDHDDTVWSCVRSRRPLLLESPGAKSSKKIEKIARRLLALESGKSEAASPRDMPSDTHHDLLEIERGATDEEVRRAYKRCREIYAPQALCCYGLFEPHELERLRIRLDEAFDVLVDPARRRPYELSVFPIAPPRDTSEAAEEPLEPAPLAPEITPDTHFTGALLRQVRVSQRLRLHEVSQRTKIRVAYLKAIEEDDFASLPAAVYTGGFVSEFAKALKLDPKQASHTYVRRYREYIDARNAASQKS